MSSKILQRIADGRTDLVFQYLSDGHPAHSTDERGNALITWCAHYGDVSGIRFLLGAGESVTTLGPISVSTAPHFTGTGSCVSSGSKTVQT